VSVRKLAEMKGDWTKGEKGVHKRPKVEHVMLTSLRLQRHEKERTKSCRNHDIDETPEHYGGKTDEDVDAGFV